MSTWQAPAAAECAERSSQKRRRGEDAEAAARSAAAEAECAERSSQKRRRGEDAEAAARSAAVETKRRRSGEKKRRRGRCRALGGPLSVGLWKDMEPWHPLGPREYIRQQVQAIKHLYFTGYTGQEWLLMTTNTILRRLNTDEFMGVGGADAAMKQAIFAAAQRLRLHPHGSQYLIVLAEAWLGVMQRFKASISARTMVLIKNNPNRHPLEILIGKLKNSNFY